MENQTNNMYNPLVKAAAGYDTADPRRSNVPSLFNFNDYLGRFHGPAYRSVLRNKAMADLSDAGKSFVAGVLARDGIAHSSLSDAAKVDMLKHNATSRMYSIDGALDSNFNPEALRVSGTGKSLDDSLGDTDMLYKHDWHGGDLTGLSAYALPTAGAPRWTDNPASKLMGAARDAAKPRWTDNPANRLMNAVREAEKAAPSFPAVQKAMAEGAGHKNPYDPNSTGGSKRPGVTPTNAPKTSWEALLETIKKYYGFAKNNIKASGGVMNWLGGNSQTLGGAPRWLVAGGGLAGLLGLGLGAKSLLSKSGSYHPVQGLPMAKLASARAMRAEDPTLLGGVSAGRPDITEGNSIGRMLEIIRTHGNQNAPYGATMPKN